MATSFSLARWVLDYLDEPPLPDYPFSAGIPSLDRAIRGLLAGDLVTIKFPTVAEATAAGQAMAMRVARERGPVMVASLRFGPEAFLHSALCRLAGVDHAGFVRGTLTAAEKGSLAEHARQAMRTALWLVGSHDRLANELANVQRQELGDRRWQLVLVDMHLRREITTRTLVKTLRTLATKHQVPVVMVSGGGAGANVFGAPLALEVDEGYVLVAGCRPARLLHLIRHPRQAPALLTVMPKELQLQCVGEQCAQQNFMQKELP